MPKMANIVLLIFENFWRCELWFSWSEFHPRNECLQPRRHALVMTPRHQVNRTLTLALTALLSRGLSVPLSAQSPSCPAIAGPRTLMQAPMGHTRNAPQHFDVLEEIQNLQQDSVGISGFGAEYKTPPDAAILASAEPLRATPGPPSAISVQRLRHHPPKTARKAFALGVTAQRKSRHTEAIKYFTTAVSLDPLYVEARAQLGVLYARTGEVSKAMEQFEQGLELDPNSSMLHFSRAWALLSLGGAAEAESEARRVLALNPQDVAAQNLLGLALRGQGGPSRLDDHRIRITPER
jgi:Flp pilus assembly protein TadD